MLRVSVFTLQKKMYEGEAEMVTVPGVDGMLGILPHHIPLVTALKEGSVDIRTKTGEERIEIEKGILEVRPKSEVILLVRTRP